jgi:nitroreductase
MNETFETLRKRRSIRKYKDQQIPREQLDEILEAATWAPSGKGLQSAVMVAVQDRETIAYLSKLNAEVLGNPAADPFYGAPTVVVVLADARAANWIQDGSLVLGSLMNAAWSLGLGSCWINRAREVFDGEEGKELLKKWGLPSYYRGVGHCILGYIDGEIPEPKPRKADYIMYV